jgi:hypothetical protein
MLVLLDETWHMQYISIYLHVSCGFRVNVCFTKEADHVIIHVMVVYLQDNTRLNIKFPYFYLKHHIVFVFQGYCVKSALILVAVIL